MLYAIIALLVITGLVIYWKYFYTYSNGYRTGILQKFSHKGNIIKTYEGEMVISSGPANTYVTVPTEKFNFSVANETVANLIETMQGQMVVVHYKQKNGVLFWHGDSKYLVDSIKRMS